jgi:diguanylate cyclase (GGDEF)-like protein
MSDPSTILIVDDNLSNRLALEALLGSCGYRLLFATSGPEALGCLEEEAVDLLLLDVMMPGMDGFEVCRRIRSSDKHGHLPIFLLTALDDRESRLRGIEAGADEFLSQPVDWAELQSRIRTLLRIDRVGKLRQQAETLNSLRTLDPLTELPNREAFLQEIANALASADPQACFGAILCLDLDGFGLINSGFGMESGDWLLQEMAVRLQALLGDKELLARISSDEFAFLLPAAGSQAAAQKAAQALEAVRRPFSRRGQEMHLTASVGIAFYPGAGARAQDLVAKAESALSRVKKSGGDGCRFFGNGMSSQALEMLTVKADLIRALDRGELQVYYQPIFDAHRQGLVAVEALLRWHHPVFDLQSPGAFLTVAEDTGLIVPIGEWLMYAACAQLLAWRQRGLGSFRLTVNVSSRQLSHSRFLAQVSGALEHARLPGEALELELTENLLVPHESTDPGHTLELLKALKALGLRLAIDDFGTGYSSLSYLKHLPVDTLKIDRTFVKNIARDAEDAAISAAIIRLAHSLSMKVVAEGVDEAEQVEVLRGLGCDALQGFLWGSPAPAEAFEANFMQWMVPRIESIRSQGKGA